MAKQIEGVSERILACARGEFLDKGFTGASLRTIAAAAADTSTNSIYVRFGDKEGLFSAIVEPLLNEMTERCLKIPEEFRQMDRAAQAAHSTPSTVATVKIRLPAPVSTGFTSACVGGATVTSGGTVTMGASVGASVGME